MEKAHHSFSVTLSPSVLTPFFYSGENKTALEKRKEEGLVKLGLCGRVQKYIKSRFQDLSHLQHIFFKRSLFTSFK
jgi:hypothetical protein